MQVASKETRGWQANKKSTYVLGLKARAMPENEKPPDSRVDVFLLKNKNLSFNL